jgi:hypothetical protein
MNLSANEVPNGVLVNAMHTALENKLAPLVKWDAQYLPKLVDHVCKAKQIVAGRMRNAAVGQARLFGYAKDDMEMQEELAIDPITGLQGESVFHLL